MSALMIGLYMLLCALLAFAARQTRIGAAGVFLLAVIFTPLAVGLLIAILRPLPHSERRRARGGAS